MNHLPGKFVWFEHVSGDTAKARAFYETLCGWSTQAMPMPDRPYQIIMNAGTGIGGYRDAETGMPSHWISYLSVPDVDKSLAAASAAGARTLMPATDLGPVGRAAAIADPTGAGVCLWKGAQGDPPDTDKTPIGGWFWNELFTTDALAALAFYEKSFGYAHDTMDMGPQGNYYLLKDTTGQMRAGVMQQPPGLNLPSHWMPYIHVADCDAAVARARQIGAREILMPPTDIPNVGRFATLLDPTGAAISIITGA